MKENNQVDQLFKSVLFDYDVEPPRYIWDDIKADLNAEGKRKRLVYAWSIAASIAIIVSFMSGYFLTNLQSSKIVTEDLQLINDNPQALGQILTESKLLENKTESPIVKVENNALNTNKLAINNTSKEVEPIIPDDKNEIAQIAIPPTENEIVSMNNSGENNRNSLFGKLFSNNIYKIERTKLKENNIIIPEEYTDYIVAGSNYSKSDNSSNSQLDNRRWTLTGQLASAYAVQNETVSADEISQLSLANIENTGKKSEEQTMMAFNSGLKVSYKLLDKLTIESGVYYSKFGQQINNARIDVNQLAYYEGSELIATNSYTTSSATGAIRYNTTDKPKGVNGEPNYTDGAIKSVLVESKLQQNFEYLEVPVNIKYKLLDGTINMQMFCGFSPGVLVANKVFIDSEGDKQWIGYTEGLNRVIYKATIGMGFEYPLSNNFHVNLEPAFRYSLNSISFQKDIKPYSIGVFTGISYFFN